METDPDQAKALLREARAGAATSLTELRELVRGISPPVLNERGLVDAVRALALDSPLEVGGQRRGPATPGPADRVRPVLRGRRTADQRGQARPCDRGRGSPSTQDDTDIVVEVEDNGRGGAEVRAGGGLAGLRRRLAVFDGTLEITSPAGGPTRVKMVVPCE